MRVNEPLSMLRAYFIRGIAGLLFLVMFLGAGAAAMALFAAGINTLAGSAAAHASPSAPVTATRAERPAGAETSTSTSQAEQSGSAPDASPFSGPNPSMTNTESGTSQMSYVDQLNNQIDHMHSPLGQSLDYGGVALGEQVQQTFGQVLSGVLKALFLEQNGTPSGGGHP